MATRVKKAHPYRILIVFIVAFVIALGSLVGGTKLSNASYVPKLALDLEGGTQLILKPKLIEGTDEAKAGTQITEADISQAIQIIRQRVDASGVSEAEITSQGTQNIVVSLPGKPTEDTLNLIRSSAVLRFRPVLFGDPTQLQEWIGQTYPEAEAAAQAKVNEINKAKGINPPAADTAGTTGQETTVVPNTGENQEGPAATAVNSSSAQPAAEATQTSAPSPSPTVTKTVTPDPAAGTATPDPKDVATPKPEETPTVQYTQEEILAQIMALSDFNGDGKLANSPATTPKDNSDRAWVTEKSAFEYFVMNCQTQDALKGGSEDDPKQPLAACARDGSGMKYLLGPADIEGTRVKRANSGLEPLPGGGTSNTWAVFLEMDAEGAKIFKDVSARLCTYHVGADGQPDNCLGNAAGQVTQPDQNRFAIVLDGLVVSSPSMNAIIADGSASITGSFTSTSAATLANQLSFGSLPLNFNVQSEEQISATLGTEHLSSGFMAGLIGLILVLIYLLWQYHGLSIVAVASLLAAAVTTYVSICLLSWLMGYRLSLAGVVGLIVAVGITVDSFIVYFERIRDQVRDGTPLVAAVSEGWEKAKRTIIISDMVNLIAATVLYFLAVGGVQGFAFTLGLTTVVDLAVIVMFTHPLMMAVIKIPFYGEGRRFSGLDPTHLGASSEAIYKGRGKVRATPKQKAGETSGEELPLGTGSIARRKAAQKAALAKAAAEQATATDVAVGQSTVDTLEATEEEIEPVAEETAMEAENSEPEEATDPPGSADEEKGDQA